LSEERPYAEWGYDELKREVILERERLKKKRERLFEARAELSKWEFEAERRRRTLQAYPVRGLLRRRRLIEEDIRRRARRIERFEAERERLRREAERYERRAREAVSPVERLISRTVAGTLREEIRRISRRIAALRGWQTRRRRELEAIDRELWPYYERIAEAESQIERLNREIAELEEEIEKEEEELRLKEEELERRKFWRVQKSREYYAVEPDPRRTPEPFLEVRIWVYTMNPERWTEEVMEELFNEMEVALNVAAGRTHIIWAKSIDVEKTMATQSYESKQVDPEEVDAPLDEPQYYLKFIRRRAGRRLETEYGTEDVQAWIKQAKRRFREWRAVRQLTLEEWSTRPAPPRRYKPRRRW